MSSPFASGRSQKADEILARIRAREGSQEVTIAGLAVNALPNVYPTGELSGLVVDALQLPGVGLAGGEAVLDYGTGTGFLAIWAAKLGAARVVATDINESAIQCARENARQHGVIAAIDARVGRCFETIQVDEKFDIILAGMPWESAEPRDMLERAVYDPNFEMRRALLERAPEHLTPNGRILTTWGERVQRQHPIESFDSRYDYSRVVERELKGELHFVYELRPRATPFLGRLPGSS